MTSLSLNTAQRKQASAGETKLSCISSVETWLQSIVGSSLSISYCSFRCFLLSAINTNVQCFPSVTFSHHQTFILNSIFLLILPSIPLSLFALSSVSRLQLEDVCPVVVASSSPLPPSQPQPDCLLSAVEYFHSQLLLLPFLDLCSHLFYILPFTPRAFCKWLLFPSFI